MPSSKIGVFWRWFAAVADEIGAEMDAPGGPSASPHLRELDDRILDLGLSEWEVGPGPSGDGGLVLVLSGGGADELDELARRVIGSAPALRGWEFTCFRPPKVGWGRQFSVQTDGREVCIDARSWNYALRQFDDGMLMLIIETGEPAITDEHVARQAAEIVAEAELGEAIAHQHIASIEVESALPEDEALGRSPIADLRDHVASLIG